MAEKRSLGEFLSVQEMCAFPVAKQRLVVASTLAREFKHLKLAVPRDAFRTDGGGWAVDEFVFFYLSMGSILPPTQKRRTDVDDDWARACAAAVDAARRREAAAMARSDDASRRARRAWGLEAEARAWERCETAVRDRRAREQRSRRRAAAKDDAERARRREARLSRRAARAARREARRAKRDEAWARRGANSNDWALTVRTRQQFSSFRQFMAYRDWVAEADERNARREARAPPAPAPKQRRRRPAKRAAAPGDAGALEFSDGGGGGTTTSAASRTSANDATSSDGSDGDAARPIELLDDDAGDRGAAAVSDAALPLRLLRLTRKLVAATSRVALARLAAVEAAGARAAQRDLTAVELRVDRRRRRTTATALVRACAIWQPPTAADAAVRPRDRASSSSSSGEASASSRGSRRGSFSARAARRRTRMDAERRAASSRRSRGVGAGGDVGAGLAADGLVVAAVAPRGGGRRVRVRVDYGSDALFGGHSTGRSGGSASETTDGGASGRDAGGDGAPQTAAFARLGKYVLRRCLHYLAPDDAARVGLCGVSLYAVNANAWGEAAHARLLSRCYGVPRDEILPFYNARRDLSAELAGQRLFSWGAVAGGGEARAARELAGLAGLGVRQLAATQRALLPVVGGADHAAALLWSGRVVAWAGGGDVDERRPARPSVSTSRTRHLVGGAAGFAALSLATGDASGVEAPRALPLVLDGRRDLPAGEAVMLLRPPAPLLTSAGLAVRCVACGGYHAAAATVAGDLYVWRAAVGDAEAAFVLGVSGDGGDGGDAPAEAAGFDLDARRGAVLGRDPKAAAPDGGAAPRAVPLDRRETTSRGASGAPVVCASVACGARTTLALGDDGRVYSFGLRCLGRRVGAATYDGDGDAGDGDGEDAAARRAWVAREMALPRALDALHDVVWVGAGESYGAALDDEGVLWLWGTGPVVRYRARGDAGVAIPISYAPLEHKYRVTGAAACWTSLVVACVPWHVAHAPVQGAHTAPPAAYMAALREPPAPPEDQE